MAAFYLISGIFCPSSFERKGFCDFVLDKLVRLGIPFFAYDMAIGPGLVAWTQAYAGGPVTYYTSRGPCWFLIWLLNFTIVYAVIAQAVRRTKSPCELRPLGCGSADPPSQERARLRTQRIIFIALPLIGFALGVAKGFINQAMGAAGVNNVGGMVEWGFGIALYIPFFAAGIVAARYDWLELVVERMPQGAAWAMRIFTLLVAVFVIPTTIVIPVQDAWYVQGILGIYGELRPEHARTHASMQPSAPPTHPLSLPQRSLAHADIRKPSADQPFFFSFAIVII